MTQASYQVVLPEVSTKRKKRRPSDEDVDLAINAHLEGYLPWEIDEALHFVDGTAERILEDYGYQARLRVPKSEYEQYPRLYMVDRMSLQAIADRFSSRNSRRSAGTVKVYLLMIGHYTDDDGKRKKIRIRHPGHRGKQGVTGTKRRVH